MKLFTLITLLVTAATAQVTPTVSGPATVRPGDSQTLAVGIAGTGATGIVGMQWTLIVPVGVTLSAPLVPNLGVNSGKGLGIFCSPPTELFCLVIGFNGTAIATNSLTDGTVGLFPITFAKTIAPGNYTISFTGNSLGVDKFGFNVPGVTNGPALNFRVITNCDLNGDGATNVADVQIIINQALGISSCTLSAGCTVIQVQQTINAALGGACQY